MPSTELGPAARDVCANGFSYAAASDTNAITNSFPTITYTSQRGTTQSTTTTSATGSESSTESTSAGNKRALDGTPLTTTTATTSHTEECMDVVAAADATHEKSFGNDTKKPRSAPKGGNRTGKTDAEKSLIHSYLRQGVDR